VGQELPAPAEHPLGFERVEFCIGDQSGRHSAPRKSFLTRCNQLLNVALVSDNGHLISSSVFGCAALLLGCGT
jgi:hypothetical protein